MVTLYTIDGCLDCQSWRKTLENHQISFVERNLLTDDHAVDDLLDVLGEIKAPVLFDNNRQIPLSSVLPSPR